MLLVFAFVNLHPGWCKCSSVSLWWMSNWNGLLVMLTRFPNWKNSLWSLCLDINFTNSRSYPLGDMIYLHWFQYGKLELNEHKYLQVRSPWIAHLSLIMYFQLMLFLLVNQCLYTFISSSSLQLDIIYLSPPLMTQTIVIIY